jgi:protein-S-isoprenylcysteine O-methyltransferase Ste14
MLAPHNLPPGQSQGGEAFGLHRLSVDMHSPLKHPPILVRPTPVFICGFIAGVFAHHLMPWPIWPAASALHVWIGVAAIATGVAGFTWGVQTMRRAGTGVMLHKAASQVVQTGPYRWSRNPQYISYTTICVGAALLANSWWPILALAPVLAIVQVGVVSAEERYMSSAFGADYAAYCRRVGRWL